VYTAICLAVITAFGFFHIELTAKVLGAALICEVVALMALAIGVLAGGGANGLSLGPINPAEVFSNHQAAKTFGAAAAGVALFGAFWSWVGFEMAPNYAEESREPRKIAKAATYGSVIGLGIFYVFISWIFVMGWGVDGVAPGVAGQFDGKYASAFYPLSDKYVGGGLTTALEIFIITSSFACAMAFYNTAARYLYSLSREKMLPAPLARTSERHSPVTAGLVVSVITGLYILGFTIYDPSTSAALLKLGTWTPLLGVLGILVVQAIASFAIIRYFLTQARDGFHWWKTLVAPVLGGGGCIVAVVLMLQNRTVLAGGNPLYISLIWVPIALFFLGGAALALYYRSKDPQRYAAIGRFVHQDA
jgi:amino acid transporter